ncbi:hypothetical protein Tco_0321086 [Tanacetum coccineum]
MGYLILKAYRTNESREDNAFIVSLFSSCLDADFCESGQVESALFILCRGLPPNCGNRKLRHISFKRQVPSEQFKIRSHHAQSSIWSVFKWNRHISSGIDYRSLVSSNLSHRDSPLVGGVGFAIEFMARFCCGYLFYVFLMLGGRRKLSDMDLALDQAGRILIQLGFASTRDDRPEKLSYRQRVFISNLWLGGLGRHDSLFCDRDDIFEVGCCSSIAGSGGKTGALFLINLITPYGKWLAGHTT